MSDGFGSIDDGTAADCKYKIDFFRQGFFYAVIDKGYERIGLDSAEYADIETGFYQLSTYFIQKTAFFDGTAAEDD